MHADLRRQLFAKLLSLECSNKGFNLYFALYDEPFANEMDARRTHTTGRAVRATIRNRLISPYLDPTIHQQVLWMDADVTQYPPDLIARLYAERPKGEPGVVAPLVVIEGSDDLDYHKRACRKRRKKKPDHWAIATPGSVSDFPLSFTPFPLHFDLLSLNFSFDCQGEQASGGHARRLEPSYEALPADAEPADAELPHPAVQPGVEPCVPQ